MDYLNILIFKRYSNFIAPDLNDYDTYIFNDDNKPTLTQMNAFNVEYKKSLCKQEAKKRIAEYDWINDNETTPVLLNKEDFYTYRSALRELILNPVENPVWPEAPQEEWA